MIEIADGIHDDITIEDYHANRSHVSATTLKYARQSMKHYQWFRDGRIQREETSAFGFGNAFELALLAPDEYVTKVAVIPDQDWIDGALTEKPDLKQPRLSAYYQKAQKEFFAEQKGKYLINQTGPESFETIECMLDSCFQDAVIQKLIKNTEYQLSLFWTDEETGIRLKTRPDICKRKKNVIVNLKTTLDGSPAGFAKDVGKYGYPLQAAVEMQGCIRTGLMEKVDTYFWLVVEKVAPFNATLYEFDTIDQKLAYDDLEFILRKIKRATDENKWPGYTEKSMNEFGILTAPIPAWYKSV